MRKNPMHDDPKIVIGIGKPTDKPDESEKTESKGMIWYRASDRERALNLALTLNAGVTTSAEQLVKDAEVIRVYLSTEES